EQVASKPMPAMRSGVTPLALRAPRTARPQARQISSEDCSTKSAPSFQMAMGWLEVPSISPRAEKTPARALPVPTSMPRKQMSEEASLERAGSVLRLMAWRVLGRRLRGRSRIEEGRRREVAELAHAV